MDVLIATPFLLVLVGTALLFDFLNGLHDSANSIATVVSTRVLAPRYAVLWAAFFNFIAFLVFGLHVAGTVGSGIIGVDVIDDSVIFGALGGAIVWNLVTWYLGIPSSSSHALVGGLLGAGIAKAGLQAIVWDGVIKTAAAIVLSPALGFGLALLLVLIVSWIFVRSVPLKVDRLFRGLQFVSASLYSLGHGGNDAQKTMGIIAVLLYSHRRRIRRQCASRPRASSLNRGAPGLRSEPAAALAGGRNAEVGDERARRYSLTFQSTTVDRDVTYAGLKQGQAGMPCCGAAQRAAPSHTLSNVSATRLPRRGRTRIVE